MSLSRSSRIRLAIYPVEEILALFRTNLPNTPARRGIKVGETVAQVKLNSDRYKLFLTKGLKCVGCSREGNMFALERAKDNCNPDAYHFNLYHAQTNKLGEMIETLMTKDHIVPKSKGGPDHIDNYQTMCTQCNRIKADKNPQTSALGLAYGI